MAIRKAKTLDTGYTGDYWAVTAINIDYIRNSTTVRISLFKDQAAREAGCRHLESQVVALTEAESILTQKIATPIKEGDVDPKLAVQPDILAVAYDGVKAKIPYFADGEDI